MSAWDRALLSTGMEKNDTYAPFGWELDLSFCGYGFGKKTSELKENDDASYMETHSQGMLILLIPVSGYLLKMCLREGVAPAFACRVLNSQIEEVKVSFGSSWGTVLPTSAHDNTAREVSVCKLWGFYWNGYQETLYYLVNEAHSPSFWNKEIHVLQRPSYMQVPKILAYSL